MSEPLVTITAQQMFEMLTRMEAVTNKLVDGLSNLKEIAEDHEDRLRVVEARAGAEKRIDALSERVTQHDAAFTKMSERLGTVEGALEGAKSAKTSAVTTAVLGSGLASLAFSIVIALIRG